MCINGGLVMKNRKSTESFRLNGSPYSDAGSIHAVAIADLEIRIVQFEAKLADPFDADDKKWTASWLKKFRQELAKKQKGLALKLRERDKSSSDHTHNRNV